MSAVKVLDTKAGMVVAIGAVGLLTLYLAEKKIREVGSSISPTNPSNIFATGVNNVGAMISGNENFKLGAWVYDVVNGTPQQQADRQAEQSFIDSIGG